MLSLEIYKLILKYINYLGFHFQTILINHIQYGILGAFTPIKYIPTLNDINVQREHKDQRAQTHPWNIPSQNRFCNNLLVEHECSISAVFITVLYSSSRRGMVRRWWMLTPFSISSLTKSTLSNTNASIMACSREMT